MRTSWWIAALVIVAASACAHMKDDMTVCPEYRELRCLTKEECTMDEERGCKVCRCEQATMDDRPRAADRPEEPVR